MIIEHS